MPNKPRVAKRFPYSCSAQISSGNELDEVMLVDISASGIQFATRHPISTKNPIRLFWLDPTYGGFDPTLQIVREASGSEKSEYKYFYGGQYFRLESELKDKLLKLLIDLRDRDKKEREEKLKTVQPLDLLIMIKKANETLDQLILDNEKAPPVVKMFLNQMPDYERRAFSIGNDIASYIKRRACQTFQCQMLYSMIPTILKEPGLQDLFLQTAVDVVSEIRKVGAETKIVVKKIGNLAATKHEQEQLKKRVLESGNRVFYVKAGLLQAVMDQFKIQLHPDQVKTKEKLKMLTAEYEETLEITHSSTFDLHDWKKTKGKKVYRSVPEAIVDIQNKPIKATFPRWGLGLAFIVMVLLLVFLLERLYT